MPDSPSFQIPSIDPARVDALRGIRFAAATAAFQIEGARSADGRGRSIWDTFVETPGRIADGSTAEPGPDSYHRAADDVRLLDDLGVDRYRFSISWVRVRPSESEPPSAAGIAYYDRLVDMLLAAGVTPHPTLYHWDLPQSLEDEGGWMRRDTASRFADYVETVAAALGDRVAHWYTINEPVSTSLQGYAIGELAPGRTLLFDSLPTVHHQLLAHGMAARVLRAHGAESVGIVNNHTLVRAASEQGEDSAAAGFYDLLHNRLFADPVLLGAYPDLESAGIPPMPIADGDLALISTPCAVYGVNFYNPTTVAATAPGSPIPFDIVPTPGAPHTGFGPLWPIDPGALEQLLVDLSDHYGAALPPVAIAENGASFPEPDVSNGAILDNERIDYLRAHLEAVARAVERGAAVTDYTVWSLHDNFEWAEGYTQRFGLVHVDHATAARTPKASFAWFRSLIQEVRR